MNEQQTIDRLVETINKLLAATLILVLAIVVIVYQHANGSACTTISNNQGDSISLVAKDTQNYWQPKDIQLITDTNLKAAVEYGQNLIAHTSRYLGPNGSEMQITNGLNCQNCHLNAGTVIFGNNYGSVNSLYPKFRARSGSIENLYKRVNDCIERSLNGKSIDSNGKEMQAIVAYINYIGSNVEKGKKAAGSGLKDLPYLDRAADPQKGSLVYQAKCQSCHQPDGQGMLNNLKTEFIYPALWGSHSFNDGAGLYRLSNFAKYVKYNMPQGATFNKPQLTDEEAWDVAAFVASQPRPHKNVPKDWPDVSKKPVDHPFAPYADDFSEKQHKYGPFKPIVDLQKKKEALSKDKKTSP
jgi:thiosulfate dehydrogenase